MVIHWERVEEAISKAEEAGCSVGVTIIAPHDAHFSYRGDDLFKSASTIKIAIMVELFRKIDRGEVSLDDTYVLSADDKVPGSGVLQELHDGIELTIGDVVYLMMSISDNPATNILIDLVGMENVNATMRELGLEESVLGRPMRGRPANEGERENLATPSELAKLMQAILDKTAASEAACTKMIDILEKQQNPRRIGRWVPEGMRWGSKTGSYDTVANDVGFVATDDGTMIISVFVADLPNMVTGEGVIGEITWSAMVAAGFVEES